MATTISLLTVNNLVWLALGWLLLPQPVWVQKTHAKIISWFKGKLGLG